MSAEKGVDKNKEEKCVLCAEVIVHSCNRKNTILEKLVTCFIMLVHA